MSTELEKLAFRRKRLIKDITNLGARIATYDADINNFAVTHAKITLEEFWSDFKITQKTIENNRNWICTDEYINESSESLYIYIKALNSLFALLPVDKACSSNQSKNHNRQHSSSIISKHKKLCKIQYPTSKVLTHEEINPSNHEEINEIKATNQKTVKTSAAVSKINQNSTNDLIHKETNKVNETNNTKTDILNNNIIKPIELSATQIESFSDDQVDFNVANETTVATKSNHKKCSTEQTSELIIHSPVQKGHFNEAWTIFTNQNNDKRVIKNSNLSRSGIATIRNNESLDACKIMRKIKIKLVLNLNFCHIDIKFWNPVIFNKSTEHISSNCIKHWNDKIKFQKKIPTFQEFVQFIKTPINSLEAAVTINNTENKAKQEISLKPKIYKREHDPFNMVNRNPSGLPSNQILKKPNGSALQQIEIIQRIDLCRNCLGQHKTIDCATRNSYFKFTTKHNSTFIHPMEQKNQVVCHILDI